LVVHNQFEQRIPINSREKLFEDTRDSAINHSRIGEQVSNKDLSSSHNWPWNRQALISYLHKQIKKVKA